MVAVDRGRRPAPKSIRFPPVLNRAHFERSGYLKSFPHLAGTVHSFAGSERAHREVLERRSQGGDWSAAFPATAVVLTPAACYPVYPMLADAVLPPRGGLIDVMSYCFRHEPSDDPAGCRCSECTSTCAPAMRRVCSHGASGGFARAEAFTAALGLDGRVELATDPFFGRGGTLLAVNQRDQRLKLEIVVPIASDERPTADHLAQLSPGPLRHGIRHRNGDGGPAHTVVRRLRPRADRARALPAPRLRSSRPGRRRSGETLGL